MEIIHKDLDYFWEFMPHGAIDRSPTQITEMNDILPQIKTIIKYLNANYAELKDEKVVYHYYENYRSKISFLGLEIILDNPESILVGRVRIYHLECEGIFYYTFETDIETGNIVEIRSNLNQILESIGLRKLSHSGVMSPILYQRFYRIDLKSFKIFFGELNQLAQNICIKAK